MNNKNIIMKEKIEKDWLEEQVSSCEEDFEDTLFALRNLPEREY